MPNIWLVWMGQNPKCLKQLDLPLEGVMSRAGTVYVTFKADLSQYVKHRPAILQWIVNPEASFGDLGMGLLRAITPWNEWIMGWALIFPKANHKSPKNKFVLDLNAFVGAEVEKCRNSKIVLLVCEPKMGNSNIQKVVYSAAVMRYIVIHHQVA